MKNIFFAIIGFLVLTGCVPKIHKAQTLDKQKMVKELEKDLQSFPNSDFTLKQKWWEEFHDKQLDTLIAKALKEAPSLKMLQARYAQANSIIDLHKSSNLLKVSFNSSISRQRFSENYIFPAPIGGGVYTFFQDEVTLDYDFDFWNSRSSLIKSAENLALSQKAIIKVKELSITTGISSLYIAWNYELEKRKKLVVLKNLFKEKQTIFQKLYKEGLINKIATENQKSSLEHMKQLILQNKMDIEDIKNSIAMLGGFLPSYIKTLQAPKIQKDPLPSTFDLHMDILSHRPDIAVEKYVLLSKGQMIEHSKSAFYPNISLRALFNVTSYEWTTLFEHSSIAPVAGAALSLPLFDAGERKAKLEHSVDDYNSQVYQYNATIIKALNEVVTTLKKIVLTQDKLLSNKKQLSAKQEIQKIQKEKFHLGLENKLGYLDSQIAFIESQLTTIQLQNEKLNLQVNLIKYLGGGGYRVKGKDADAKLL